MTFVPGGIKRRDIGIGVKMNKKSSGNESGSSGDGTSSETGLKVVIVVPVGLTTQSVDVTGPNGFSATITESTDFNDAAPGEYVITPDAIAGYIERVFYSPSTVLNGQQTTAFVIYDSEGNGGGGDCTPTCPINGLRWVVPGTLPSIDYTVNFPFSLDAIPDSDFTTDPDLFLLSIGQNETKSFFVRYFGNICPGDFVDWSVNHSNAVGDNASALSIYAKSFGRTFLVEASFESGFSNPIGIVEIGLVVSAALYHKNGTGQLENVCSLLEDQGLSGSVTLQRDFGEPN